MKIYYSKYVNKNPNVVLESKVSIATAAYTQTMNRAVAFMLLSHQDSH